MADTVEIIEVSARDGIQNERALVSTETKLELIARAVAAGVRRLEVTSFVNPKRVPQMADAEDVMAALPREPGTSYIGLVLNRPLDVTLDNGAFVDCKLPDWFVGHMCSIPVDEDRLTGKLWDSLNELPDITTLRR